MTFRMLCACAASLTLALLPMFAQTAFVDDAKRPIALPQRISRVFAAGAPAEVLLYTLTPEMLVGRNRLPEREAVEFFPPPYRNPVLIRRLPEANHPESDRELLALKPEIYIDYGSMHEDYIASIEAVQRRTGVPGIILDGALPRVPETYRRLGAALGVASRGERLAAVAERMLTTFRGALASSKARVYLACSADVVVPCLADESGGEQLAWLGGVNVAGTSASAPERALAVEEIKALRPNTIIVSGAGAAARLRENPAWQSVEAVAAGRVYEWPQLPYSWGSRPPSINRLPGLVWLAYKASDRAFDAAFYAEIRGFYRDFYHLELTESQMRIVLGASDP